MVDGRGSVPVVVIDEAQHLSDAALLDLAGFLDFGDWAGGILRSCEAAQQAGTGPIRVFRHGKRSSLYMTLTVIHANFPRGRDLALYRRVEAVEADVADAHRRIHREIIERKRASAPTRSSSRRDVVPVDRESEHTSRSPPLGRLHGFTALRRQIAGGS